LTLEKVKFFIYIYIFLPCFQKYFITGLVLDLVKHFFQSPDFNKLMSSWVEDTRTWPWTAEFYPWNWILSRHWWIQDEVRWPQKLMVFLSFTPLNGNVHFCRFLFKFTTLYNQTWASAAVFLTLSIPLMHSVNVQVPHHMWPVL
jgi:hypothetical protein